MSYLWAAIAVAVCAAALVGGNMLGRWAERRRAPRPAPAPPEWESVLQRLERQQELARADNVQSTAFFMEVLKDQRAESARVIGQVTGIVEDQRQHAHVLIGLVQNTLLMTGRASAPMGPPPPTRDSQVMDDETEMQLERQRAGLNPLPPDDFVDTGTLSEEELRGAEADIMASEIMRANGAPR